MKYKELSSRQRTLCLLGGVLSLGVLALIVSRTIEIPLPFLGTLRVDKNNKDTNNVLPINKLPPDLQGLPDAVIPKIWALFEERNKLLKERNKLLEEKRGLENDIQNSFRLIDRKLTTNGTINTNRTFIDERGRELNKHIQRCLVAIGSYNGDINGDPGLTSSAIKQFQASKNITVDGIIGRNTWREIIKEFERKKSQ